MKKQNPFSDIFDDVSELTFISDDEGLVSVKGKADLGGKIFKISIRRRANDGNAVPAAHKSLFSGTVSMISPLDGRVLISEVKRRKKEAAGVEYEQKDVYASINYRCDCADPDVIATTLRRQVDKLILENEETDLHQ